MKSAELRNKETPELLSLIEELSHKLWKSRFDNFANQLDNTASIRNLRRDIARVKTIITQRDESA